MRTDDLVRITGADPALLDALDQVATVYSGRHGIALALAPEEVRAILQDMTGATITSAPSNVNFTVFDGERLVGTISIPGPNGQSRVLELR